MEWYPKSIAIREDLTGFHNSMIKMELAGMMRKVGMAAW